MFCSSGSPTPASCVLGLEDSATGLSISTSVNNFVWSSVSSLVQQVELRENPCFVFGAISGVKRHLFTPPQEESHSSPAPHPLCPPQHSAGLVHSGSPHPHLFLVFLETAVTLIGQAVVELLISLPLPLEGWGCLQVSATGMSPGLQFFVDGL